MAPAADLEESDRQWNLPLDVAMTEELLTIVQELAAVTRLVDGNDVPAILERFVARLVATIPEV